MHITAKEAHAPAAHHEHMSPWPPVLALGTLLLYFGVIFHGWVLGLGIILFLVALFGWILEDYTRWKDPSLDYHEHIEPPEDASFLARWMARPVAWWGIVLFLLTEIMLFGALFGLYFVSRAAAGGFPPAGAPQLPVFATGINTAILVSSGFTMHFGIMAMRRGSRTWFLGMFALTIFLGGLFLYNQVSEYLELFHEGFSLSSGVYGAAFFSLTGVHGAHVTAGLAGLTAVFLRGMGGQFDGKRHMGVEGVSIYWHFVDIVWIFLFLVIYFLPSIHWM